MVYNGIPRFTSLHQLKRLKRTEHDTKYHFWWSIPNRHDLLAVVPPAATAPAIFNCSPSRLHLETETRSHFLRRQIDWRQHAVGSGYKNSVFPSLSSVRTLDLFPCCVEVETIRLGTCYHLSLWPRKGEHAQTYGSRDGKENVDFGSLFDLGSG